MSMKSCVPMVFIVPVVLLMATACPQSGGPESSAPGARTGAPHTIPPRGGPPETLDTTYDPGSDPLNKEGWDFSRRRLPEDAEDARKKPFTIEALYQIKMLSDLRWSPDGTQLLFVASAFELKTGKSNSDIYRVAVSGAGLRRMTHHEAGDSSPRWAPDGKSFLFVSSRGGDEQLWRMEIDGGEPERLTEISTGVSEPIWAPDGRRIAFVSSVFPEHGADDAGNKALLKEIKDSPFKAHLADELLFRHWSFYKGGRRSHVLLLDLASKKITDLTPGDYDSPAFSLGDPGLAYSPDGAELCFVSNREASSAQAWTTNKDLWVVPVAGGEAVNLTASNRAADGHPRYSPDGKLIAYLRQATPGYESDRPVLTLYERQTGKTRLITQELDSWVLDFHWAADSQALVFQGADKGRFPLYRVELQSGKITRLKIPSVREFHLSSHGRLAFTHSRVGTPRELFSAAADGGQARRLTHFSRELSEQYDLRPAEELWIEGAAGRKVHTFIVKPHGFKPGKRYPLVINVHGGPQYQWSDAFRGDWQVYPGAGYVVAFFNPHGSIGYGQDYTAAISKDWGGKVYKDVMMVTDALAELPYVDPARMGAMGWSYGGYMMNWLLGHTDRFKAVASMMGIYDLTSFYGATEELWFPEWDLGRAPWDSRQAYAESSPASYAEKFKTPTLIITGEKDYRVPYTQSLQLFTALRRQAVPARLIVFPNDGHWPSWVKSMPLYYAAHLDWFHRYLGGEPAPYEIKEMVRGRAFGVKAK